MDLAIVSCNPWKVYYMFYRCTTSHPINRSSVCTAMCHMLFFFYFYNDFFNESYWSFRKTPQRFSNKGLLLLSMHERNKSYLSLWEMGSSSHYSKDLFIVLLEIRLVFLTSTFSVSPIKHFCHVLCFSETQNKYYFWNHCCIIISMKHMYRLDIVYRVQTVTPKSTGHLRYAWHVNHVHNKCGLQHMWLLRQHLFALILFWYFTSNAIHLEI